MKWGRRGAAVATSDTNARNPVTGAGRIVVLASGEGTNMQAIVDACASGVLPATVAAVVCNRAEAGVLRRAASAGIEAVVLQRKPGEERPAYDKRLAAEVRRFHPDYVVLVGWMRVLTMEFLGRFPNRVVNLHPALPGQFPGTHAIERALEAAQRLGLNRTGVMVHFVPDEGVDVGPVIISRDVPIRPDDSLESLEARVHTAEHEVIVEALRSLLTPS